MVSRIADHVEENSRNKGCQNNGKESSSKDNLNFKTGLVQFFSNKH